MSSNFDHPRDEQCGEKRADDCPPMLVPAYHMEEANQEIQLFSGEMELIRGAAVCRGLGTVRLVWLPSPRIRFTLESGDGLADFDEPAATLRVEARTFLVLIFSESAADPPGRHYFAGSITEELEPKSTTVDSVIAHLVNFPEYVGQPVVPPGGGLLRGRLESGSEEWVVRIDQCPDCKSLTEAAKAVGGFTISHTCRISRRDGQRFPPPGPLDQLLRFLSFARGAWGGLVLPVGFDAEGARVWEQWFCQKARSHAGLVTWFPVHEPQAYVETFGRFVELWEDPNARRTLSLGIAWYVHAVSMGELETRMVDASAGLELLAYFALVHWSLGPGKSDTNFEKLNLDQRIRRLTCACGIPAVLPQGLKNCQALIKGPNEWKHKDGPEVVAWVRNSIIHPLPRLPLTHDIVHEALQLALQYMELSILRLLDYSGPYTNRVRWLSEMLWQGDYDRVPWAKSDADE